MKRVISLIALALCGLLLFAACGGSGSSAPASSSIITLEETGGGPPIPPGEDAAGGVVSGSGAAGAGQSAPSSASLTADGEEIHSLTGTIEDSGMGKYYVALESGVVIPFDYTSADISGLTEYMPGSPITVYYTGTLDGADTSAVTVVRMETPKA